jgi:hypothetical protein
MTLRHDKIAERVSSIKEIRNDMAELENSYLFLMINSRICTNSSNCSIFFELKSLFQEDKFV